MARRAARQSQHGPGFPTSNGGVPPLRKREQCDLSPMPTERPPAQADQSRRQPDQSQTNGEQTSGVEPGKWPAFLQFVYILTDDKVRLNRLIYFIIMIAPVVGIVCAVPAGLVYLMLQHYPVAAKIGITLGSSLVITLGSVILRRLLPKRRDRK